jgi:dimethylargininase
MSSLALPARVVVRGVSLAYAACLRADGGPEIEVARARAQHEAYVQTCRRLGLPVDVVPTDDACPDACFIEDTAVVTGRHALLTRPGAPSRRPEVGPVGAALSAHLIVHRMDEPATLDGGDVLRAGEVLFVGLTARTNPLGVARLAEVAALDGLRVVALEVPAGLHLKSGCTLADATTLLYASSLVDRAALNAFATAGIKCLEAPEVYGANVLALGSHVLVSASAPRTAALLRARSLDVHTLDVDELHKGDGALTCLSLRLPPAEGWTT